MALKYIQTKSTTLTYGISDSSTTIQLKNLLKLDGTSISASDIGDILYGTFAPGTSREEIFSIVGSNVTVESDGKITITSVSRGLKEVSPYDSGGFKCDHPANEVVIFGNNPQVYNYLKEYIDDIVIAGGVDASSSVKGISKLSVDPANSSNPIAVGDNDPRLPTTNQKAALAGSQGVPNATNTYLTKDNVYDSDTDQTQTTQDSTVEFGMENTTGNKNKITQSFIPGKTKIRGVALNKQANTGTFTGNITVELYADSAGNPTGSALASVTILNATYNAYPTGEFQALFSSEYSSLVVGNTYHLLISSSTSDSSNHPNLGVNTAGGYANGSVKYYNGTDGYVAVANIDLYFKTLQGITNQIPYISQNLITRRYVPIYESRGDGTSRYDITNPSGTTFRYTWDGTGTDPVINSTTFPTGKKVYLTNFLGNNAYNNGVFTITGSGTNYFEITISSGGATSNDETGKGVYLITDSFTWTKPVGLKGAEVELVGGSGSVKTPTSGNEIGGSGSGGYVYKLYNASDLLSSETVTVGIKSFNPLSGSQQQTGATSSTFKSLTGGASGNSTSNGVGTTGGSASGGDINLPGQNGGGANDYYIGYGGSNPLGFGGVNYNGNSQAVIGNGYGSGTSGVAYSQSGNSGNDGIVIIKEYY